MTKALPYLLDANSFIRAKRDHYGFDFCPGYWQALLKAHALNRLVSITPVRKELLKGQDELATWAKEETPASFFKDVKDQAVVAQLRLISDWVNNNKQFQQAAKDHFLKGADPWLIAYAKANRYQITTYEVAAPLSQSSVKLPDVAKHFEVACCQPFDMLRGLKVKLRLASSSFK